MSNCPLSKIPLGTLAEVFRASPLAICLIEMPQKQYKWANERYCSLWGGSVTEQSIVGLNVSELLTDPNSNALMALENAHNQNVSTEFELWSSSSFKGKKTYWSGAIIPVYSHNEQGVGTVTGVLSLLVDVTEKVEATNVAKNSLATLEAEKVRHQDFLRFVTHELRTPLTVLQLLAQACLRSLEKKSHDLLGHHLNNIMRQVGLVHRLMTDISAPHSLDSFNCNFEQVLFNEFLINTFRELSHIAAGYNVVTEVPLDCDAKVSVDKHRFYQVLSNLFTNAVKFSKAGSQILCRVSYTQNVARFEITDDGSGISKDILDKIFEKSYRSHQAAATDGAGLGLFLSKNIIETMSGRMWAESSGFGKGSTFFIELPVLETVATV